MPIRLGANLIKTLRLGTAPVQKVFLGTKQIWANEVVVVLGNTTTNVNLKTLFTLAEWGDANLKKRVVVNAGVNIGSTQGAYAIAATTTADGQAGSWAGELTLDVRGTVSGVGGAANSGKGGDVILGNFPGRTGQKLIVNLYSGGIIRAGGGGGGRGGNGGGGYYTDDQYHLYPYSRYGANWEWYQGRYQIYLSANGWSALNVGGASTYTSGGYVYSRGAYVESYGGDGYQISRRLVTPNTVYTGGGAGGNGGRGQGYDGANAGGSAGAAGGTNAGAGGTGGTGAGYGGTGNTGNTGGAGNNGGGLAGAAGGLAGFYINGIANVTLNNLGGTLQGRVA